jgi:hypothetical protein
LNSTDDKKPQATKPKQPNSDVGQFDLTIAYRLLIGAYMRSAGKVKQGDNHMTEPSQHMKRNSREIYRHRVDFSH